MEIAANANWPAFASHRKARAIRSQNMFNLLQRDQTVKGSEDHKAYGVELSEVRRAEAFLMDKISRARLLPENEFLSEIITLTPPLAYVLLQRNPDNRKIKDAKLGDYEADIVSGSWSLNGESIKISRDGFLNDGQHRCQAVVNTHIGIRTQILFGVSRESRTTIDQGAQRSPGDMIGMLGASYANQVAATCRLVWQYETRGTVSNQKHFCPTKAQIIETWKTRPEIIDSVKSIPSAGSNLYGGHSVLAFCHYLFSKIDPDRANYFITKLRNGDELTQSDPIYMLRQRLLDRRNRFRPEEKIEIIFRAWNLHVTGRQHERSISVLGKIPSLEMGSR